MPRRRPRPAPTLGPILGLAVALLASVPGAGPAACAGDASEEPPEATRQAPIAPAPSARRPPPSRPPGGVERLEVRVLAEYPHDPEAFTQGLLVHDGLLYESTGRHGASELRRVAPETGEVLLRRELPGHFFGEGLALVPGSGGEPARLVQLTWQEETALVWDAADLTARGELAYRGEGWGLAWDGSRLVMSDGSSWLSFREPAGFAEVERLRVTLGGRPVSRLNELEWADGALWANVWGSTEVVRIDPATGEVTGVADLSELERRLPPEESRGIDVLNGIAWWPERGTFLVTGKLWPRLFEVALE
jgi:glutaminyl-peptide cyclotransferase